MTDIETLLGSDADNLLQHHCQTIAKEKLYLPGNDFIDRVMIDITAQTQYYAQCKLCLITAD